MSVRTSCPNCQAALKVPDESAGRRLKCPKCGTKFHASAQGPATPSGAGLPTSASGLPAAVPSSSAHPVARDDDDLILPTVTRDFREAFDLPLLRDEPAAPASPRAEASAAGLLDEPSRPRPRKAVGGDARKEARRCTCGSVVPVGMSLCTRCGLDLDTGARIDVDDLLEEPVAAPRGPSIPMGVVFVGVVTSIASLALVGIALFFYFSRPEEAFRWGYLLLGLVAGYGVYASVRFLQGRTMRHLLTALLIGAFVDLTALVIWPVVQADLVPAASAGLEPGTGEPAEDGPVFDPTYEPIAEEEDGSLEADYAHELKPLTDRIAWRKVQAGLVILLIDAALIVYLTAGPARDYFERRRGFAFSLDGASPISG